MQTLTESVFNLSLPGGVFRNTLLRQLFPGLSEGARKLLLHRAIEHQEVVRIVPGLFILAPRFRKSELHPFVMAALIHSPSHVSLESALGFHGLIPEAVFQVGSVIAQRARRFETPVGVFTFACVPCERPLVGVRMVKLDDVFWAMVATPLRAIADRLYLSREISWQKHGLSFLVESLRIEEEDLGRLDFGDLAEILDGLHSPRVREYLIGLSKELAYER